MRRVLVCRFLDRTTDAQEHGGVLLLVLIPSPLPLEECPAITLAVVM
jgi:hypothetical protein